MGERVRVLGRVMLEDTAADRALGRGQARELLALLVARRGKPLPTPEIIDAMWPTDPPATATTIVHGLVRRIRQALGPDGLVLGEDGYRLDLDDDDVDLWQVDHALAAGDSAHARDLWREPAFGSFSTRPWALDAVAEVADRLRPPPVTPELLRIRRRVPVNRLVGRRRELAAVAAACRRSRLVTIVGLGGVGKSRLALEAARQLDFDAVVQVDVGAAAGPAASRLAAEVGQATTGDPDADLHATASLIGRTRQLLLVDGCEHDLAGAAQVVEFLLGACPELTVVATSRLVLGVPGEHVIPLMPFTDAADPRGDAVELLLDRAQGKGLIVTADDRQIAADICRRCAGVPLAIELAASELIFGPPGHEPRAGGPEEAVTGAVVQALAQLSEPAAVTARRASLLVAGFTPDLVVRLCPDPGAATGVFHELVASGLVVAETSGTSRRLRFLDRVRDALLATNTVEDRHVARAALGEVFAAMRPGLGDVISIPKLVLAVGELANADAVLQSLAADGAWDEALPLVIAAADAWAEDGQWVHGVAHVSAALDGAADADPIQRARAVRALGAVTGTYDGARRLAARLEEALTIARHAGDPALHGHLLLHLANAYGYDGRIPEALECVREMTQLGEDTGSEYIQAGAASLAALGQLLLGDPQGAQPILVEQARRLLAIGALSDAARMNRSASVAFRAGGDLDQALSHLVAAEELALESHARGTLATVRTDLADLRMQQGTDDAGAALESALTSVLAIGNVRAAGILRTRLGTLHGDAATTALGTLDLWHSDRRWAAASLASLLDLLPATHPLQALGPRVVTALDTEWGTPLDAAEAARVAPLAARDGSPLPSDWDEVVARHLLAVVSS